MSDIRITSSGNVGLGSINQAATTFNIGGQSVPRPIAIQPVANGYTISIGCQTFVFESLANLLYRIEEYYNNPAATEGHFQEHKALPIILPKKK
jgi:hypothetical protein